jgi:hypothetical protein
VGDEGGRVLGFVALVHVGVFLLLWYRVLVSGIAEDWGCVQLVQ